MASSLSSDEEQKDRIEPQEAPVARRKRPAKSKTRKKLEEAYKASYDEIPDSIRCAACGASIRKENAERHHPAGRRKAAFLFTVMVHGSCHKRVHDDPKWGSDRGLLWSGRNSKTLDEKEAEILTMKMPCPPLYALEIFKKHKQ